jgi:thiamine pyrophosphokinase
MIRKILADPPTYKSILCLDGTLPCDLIKELNLPVVAADGAANTLIKNGVEPEIIIGDLDSVNADLLQNRRHIKIENQDSTDFEKALSFIEEKSMTPAIVAGIDGGYIDHILGNVSIFSATKFTAVTSDMIFMAVDDKKILNVPEDTKISILGMPRCVIKSSGLKWELNNHELSVMGQTSLCNRAASRQVELDVISGKAIVFVYTRPISDAGSCFENQRGAILDFFRPEK